MGEKEFSKRKSLRLSGFNYSNSGVYFITICTKDRKKILSKIVNSEEASLRDQDSLCVGVGASTTRKAQSIALSDEGSPVGVGALDDPRTELTKIGEIVKSRLLSSERIPGVKINEYVIMPNHIHVIIWLDSSEKDGSSWAPTPTNATIPNVVSTFKRLCGKDIGYNIFQRGYMDHIIRSSEDYDMHLRYIIENPKKWYYDELYTEE